VYKHKLAKKKETLILLFNIRVEVNSFA